ncbi:S-adenosyl-L-methionine-dependent methyltransferase [Trametes cingulata]|nr:S-adenosyl-L-methionine-dependent methyltransferase [Trametes cingulata]
MLSVCKRSSSRGPDVLVCPTRPAATLPFELVSQNMAFASNGTYPAVAVPEETQRLDDMHHGISEFFGGLSFAKFDNPIAILEIGGAWAIQAAEMFPGARVVAIDRNPIPPRPLPHNLEFHRADITQPFPFEEEVFDVVHIRLVLLHVPHAEDVLRRAMDLVKPGGWLLVEEPDTYDLTDNGGPLPPGMSTLLNGWLKVLTSSGADPGFGNKVEMLVKSSQLFSEVNMKAVDVPISGKTDDARLKKLGKTWQQNPVRMGQDLPKRWAGHGITEEVGRRFVVEVLDPSRNLSTRMYFTWSRRRE